jgi:hypothetical protein
MKAQYVYESMSFRRGGDPYDILDIGNRILRMSKNPTGLPLYRHLFDLDDDDLNDLGNYKESYEKARQIFLKYAKFAAVLDYMIDSEPNIPDYWSDIDEHGVMSEGFVEDMKDDEEFFKNWVINTINSFSDWADVDTKKYEQIVNKI